MPTVRRVINSVTGAALYTNADPRDASFQGVRNDAQTPAATSRSESPFVFTGEVTAVAGTGVLVSVNGKPQRATPATDEPMQPGFKVWLMTAADGALILLGRDKRDVK